MSDSHMTAGSKPYLNIKGALCCGLSRNVRKPPQICLKSPGFPFKLYIVFPFSIHDSLVHLADVGGCDTIIVDLSK